MTRYVGIHIMFRLSHRAPRNVNLVHDRETPMGKRRCHGGHESMLNYPVTDVLSYCRHFFRYKITCEVDRTRQGWTNVANIDREEWYSPRTHVFRDRKVTFWRSIAISFDNASGMVRKFTAWIVRVKELMTSLGGSSPWELTCNAHLWTLHRDNVRQKHTVWAVSMNSLELEQ